MIISKTPLRFSFAGGGTDLRSFYKENGYGAVFSTSIDQYIYVVVRTHGQLYEEHTRLNYSETEQVNHLDDIRNPIIRECIRFLDIDDKLYISTVADVPGSSGLGSSSTFCVGLLNVLYRYKGEKVTRGRLAEEAAHIELDVLGRPMGKQDHVAAAFGGMNFIEFHSDESISLKPVNLGTNEIGKLFSEMNSYWTGIERPSESVLSAQDENSGSNIDTLLEMRNQANLCLELFLSGNISNKKVGELLHAGWCRKRTLAQGVSMEWIDDAYDLGLANGAYGGKLSGAGGGGFLSMMVPSLCSKKVDQAMNASGLVSYRFRPDTSGSTIFEIG